MGHAARALPPHGAVVPNRHSGLHLLALLPASAWIVSKGDSGGSVSHRATFCHGLWSDVRLVVMPSLLADCATSAEKIASLWRIKNR
jgi:hypothetical protein